MELCKRIPESTKCGTCLVNLRRGLLVEYKNKLMRANACTAVKLAEEIKKIADGVSVNYPYLVALITTSVKTASKIAEYDTRFVKLGGAMCANIFGENASHTLK